MFCLLRLRHLPSLKLSALLSFLPKNVGVAFEYVGICRLHSFHVPAFFLFSTISPLLSIPCPRFYFGWSTGIRFARFCFNIRNGLPGVAGAEPRLGNRFRASIGKRGLAPAPFFILLMVRQMHPGGSPKRQDIQGRTGIRPFSLRNGAKKVSGRWGDRPLGRGDGGYCNLKPARVSLHAVELAISGTTGAIKPQHRSEIPPNSRLHLRFCSLPPPPSIVRRVHFVQYSRLISGALARYLRTPTLFSSLFGNHPDGPSRERQPSTGRSSASARLTESGVGVCRVPPSSKAPQR